MQEAVKPFFYAPFLAAETEVGKKKKEEEGEKKKSLRGGKA
jgi:hypothetical protein